HSLRRDTPWRVAPWARPGVFPQPLLALDREVGAAILRPARLVVFLALRTVLAVADDGDPPRVHAPRDEIVHGRLGPPLAERQVVFVGAALVAVPLDEEQLVRVRLEPR